MNNKRPINIAIDFDGTCVKHAYPLVGEDVGAAPVLRWLTDHGCRLILFTMRSDPSADAVSDIIEVSRPLSDAVSWFDANGIPLFGVNRNPEQDAWTSSPKAYAHIYIDDAGLGCPLVEVKGERPWVDWPTVQLQLSKLLEIPITL